MTKTELHALIRETLKEELDQVRRRKLTEGHEMYDLGYGYYADINLDGEDEDEDDDGDIEVDIYENTYGNMDSIRDRYIKTVKSVDEAREYVARLCDHAKTCTVKLPSNIRCGKCSTAFKLSTSDIRDRKVVCPNCNTNLRVPSFYKYTCPNCGEQHSMSQLVIARRWTRCPDCDVAINFEY